MKVCKRTLGVAVTKAAIKKELQQMLEKKVFTPVHKRDIKDEKKIIPSMLFMKEKYNAEGTFEKLKARLVGMGNYENRANFLSNGSTKVSVQIVFDLSTHKYFCFTQTKVFGIRNLTSNKITNRLRPSFTYAI